jgi:hypothetical protein
MRRRAVRLPLLIFRRAEQGFSRLCDMFCRASRPPDRAPRGGRTSRLNLSGVSCPAMLTISEMRGRARAFVNEWDGETREAAERQTFWNDWFEVFGIRRRRRVTFERNVKKLSGTTGQIDAFWPGMLLVARKRLTTAR